MSPPAQCPRCGEAGPTTLVVIGNDRVGVCANQHKMTQDPLVTEPPAYGRMSNWLRQLERGTRASF